MVALRNRKFHMYNRVYLLSAVAASLTLPFANFKCFDITKAENTTFKSLISVLSFPEADHRGISFYAFVMIATMIIVSLFLLIVMVLNIIRVHRIKRVHDCVRIGNIDFVRTGIRDAPFSFLNTLFWREDLSTTDSNGKRIFLHELTHIRQRHTCDKLCVQAATCIWWVNPFFWLIQKELNVVHEFLADAAAVEDGDTGSFALMLLQCHNQGRHLDPKHYFFQSPVLRRLKMIASHGDGSSGLLQKCLVLPLIALLLILFSFKMSQIKDNVPTAQRLEKAFPASPQSAWSFSIKYRYWTDI
jgi:beta-lactamase regulating signal transducer with metallopeptidase domain